MDPLVSIIIPCHNAVPWLAETLESALGQTWSEKEIILVDDGSTDNSLAIARSYEPRGVRVLSQRNRGAASARNTGLHEAHGDYLQFLDADDLLAPDKLARQLQAVPTAPGALLAARWGRFHPDPAAAVFVPEKNWRSLPAIDWLLLNFSGEGMMPPASWLAPRGAVETAGPWDETLTLNDDGEYFCRVALAAAGVVFCPDAVCFYRTGHTASLSRRRTAAAWNSGWRSQQLCRQLLLAREDSPRTRRACADLFQRFAYAAYADAPDPARQAAQAARELGGSDQQPRGGPLFRLLARLAGWKTAVRLQHWRNERT